MTIHEYAEFVGLAVLDASAAVEIHLQGEVDLLSVDADPRKDGAAPDHDVVHDLLQKAKKGEKCGFILHWSCGAVQRTTPFKSSTWAAAVLLPKVL